MSSRLKSFLLISYGFAIIVIAFSLFGAFSKAYAHGEAQWIADGHYMTGNGAVHCCDERDCEPVPDGKVVFTEKGWLVVETGQLLDPKMVGFHGSIDQRMWWCRRENSELYYIDQKNDYYVRCIFFPGSS